MNYVPMVIRRAPPVIELPRASAGHPRMIDILQTVAFVECMQVDWITSSLRSPEYVRARWVYCVLARQITGNSIERIGKVINRHHTTVIHALAKAEACDWFAPKAARVVAHLSTQFPRWAEERSAA